MKQQLNINKSRPKSLGQNIIDDEFSRKLSKSINSDKDTNIIEIGPGKGALTGYLLEKEFKSIVLIEKDKELYQNLYKSFKNDKRIEVKNIDALHVKYEKLKLEEKLQLLETCHSMFQLNYSLSGWIQNNGLLSIIEWFLCSKRSGR